MSVSVSIPPLTGDIKSHLLQFTALLSDMDRAYEDIASKAGFQCRGCDENCCNSLFYHHTLLEYAHLTAGVLSLDPGVQNRVFATATSGPAGMCPLNSVGKCLVYDNRPMICRLHGIPHYLQTPSGRERHFPGCHWFESRRTDGCKPSLDRTPLYQQLAAIEQQARAACGFSGRLKLTIAEMIITVAP